jgi:hypothetical protein
MPRIDIKEVTSRILLRIHHNIKSLFRSTYILLLLIFITSRVIYYLLGVRFDSRGLAWFFQFLDPELLRHNLLQSLFYLHIQPPGYNFFLGVVLKLFPHVYSAAFHAIHLGFGATITCLLFYLMKSFKIRTGVALTVTTLFIVSPGVTLYENFIIYEYQVAFLLITSAAFLSHFFSRHKTASAIGFLVCQFWLVMIRNHYHLLYFIAVFVLLLYFARRNRRLIAGAGSVLLAVVLALYLKNQILFGRFVSSTWLGMNAALITTHRLTPQERHFFLSRGEISKASTETDPGFPLSAYRPYITMPATTSIPVLDQEVKSTGAVNFNNRGFLEVQKLYLKDGIFILRHYPIAYARSIAIAWFAYFLPTGDFTFFDLNLPRIRGIERFFDVVFFGQFRQIIDRNALRQIKFPAIVLYTGFFMLIGLPALVIFATWFLYQGMRRHTLDTPKVLLLGFMLFNIVYCTVIANFLGCSLETNRYRFPVDGFYVVLAALAINLLFNWHPFRLLGKGQITTLNGKQ